jgi:hypothetical protein
LDLGTMLRVSPLIELDATLLSSTSSMADLGIYTPHFNLLNLRTFDMARASCVHAGALVDWARMVYNRVIDTLSCGVHAQSSIVPVCIVILAGLGKFGVEWKLEPVRRMEATVTVIIYTDLKTTPSTRTRNLTDPESSESTRA